MRMFPNQREKATNVSFATSFQNNAILPTVKLYYKEPHIGTMIGPLNSGGRASISYHCQPAFLCQSR